MLIDDMLAMAEAEGVDGFVNKLAGLERVLTSQDPLFVQARLRDFLGAMWFMHSAAATFLLIVHDEQRDYAADVFQRLCAIKRQIARRGGEITDDPNAEIEALRQAGLLRRKDPQ